MKKLLRELTDKEFSKLSKDIRREHRKHKWCCTDCKYNMLTCCQEFRDKRMYKFAKKYRKFLDDEWAMDSNYNIVDPDNDVNPRDSGFKLYLDKSNGQYFKTKSNLTGFLEFAEVCKSIDELSEITTYVFIIGELKYCRGRCIPIENETKLLNFSYGSFLIKDAFKYYLENQDIKEDIGIERLLYKIVPTKQYDLLYKTVYTRVYYSFKGKDRFDYTEYGF